MSKKFIALVFAIAVLVFGGLLYLSIYPTAEKNAPENQAGDIGSQTRTLDLNPNPGESFKSEDIEEGEGQEAKAGDTAVVHYEGTLEDGTVFDSSYGRGEPFEVTLGQGQVIAGWELGIPGMKVGGKRRLIIPPELGYGQQEAGGIPPNSTLIFEIELLEIK